MKKTYKLLIFALCSLLSACTDSIDETDQGLNAPQSKALVTEESNKVDLNAIVSLNQIQQPETRSAANIQTRIECIKSNMNDTCLYVYKKAEGGWTIYSSDTRVPPIVAQSDSGSFEDLMKIEGAKLWIKSMAEDLAVIKQQPDKNLNFSQKEIENNRDFWKSISSPDKFVKQNIHRLKKDSLNLEPIDTTLLLLDGHYELYSTVTKEEILKSAYNLTRTKWHQENPYNNGCPQRTDKPNEKAPVGCVPLAIGQVFYYLHYHLGVPEKAPSRADCPGNIFSYTSTQSDYNSEIWDLMADDGAAAAPLLANLGIRANVQYGNFETSAPLAGLQEKVFAPYGISSVYYPIIDYSVLSSNLLAKLPVVLGAHEGKTGAGHAFVADEYKKSRIVTVNTYIWKYDNPKPGVKLPFVKDKEEYIYTSSATEYISMNWGWKESYNYKEWLTLTGDWICSAPGMSSYNWAINRVMIADFKAINQ